MQRSQVYKLIDGERDYQDWRWNSEKRTGIPDEDKQPAEWINYIEYCLYEAKKSNYFLSKEDTMSNIRKIAGLAVRAMEIHGAPERLIPSESEN